MDRGVSEGLRGGPERLVVVTGTGTDIGKTWLGARVLTRLREDGLRVAARKPVQSFESGAGPTDAQVLADATGEDPRDVCPAHRWYERPLAPPMAADVLGRAPFTISDLVGEITWPDGVDVGLVEGVGGPRSPLAADGDTVDLVRALSPSVVVLVGDAGLGAINAVRLSAAALPAAIVVLNRYDRADELHVRNRRWLADQCGFDVAISAEEVADRLAR
jgi:dethiobiotin synthetase